MKNKKIICVLLAILMTFSFVGCTSDLGSRDAPSETTSQIEINSSADNESKEEIVVSDEVKQSANDTSDAIESGEDLASNEQIEASIDEEKALENDASVEQENVSYDGTNSKQGLNLIGSYQGLTYFNQGDSRWGSKLYTSTGNKSQTIKSSGCGPTAAAMVVSSSKGLILPPTMSDLFVDNNFRTANNGTAWKAFPFVADFFDFGFYDETYSFSEALSYMKTDKDKNGISDYFIIMSCNSGLWTTGGHYVVWMNQSGSQSTIYDPFLYGGKFNTASRRPANVTVSGNAAYLTSTNLQKYSNAKCYFVFSNDQTGKATSSNSSKPSSTVSSTTSVSYTRYVATQSQNLNIRSGPGTGYSIIGSLEKGTKVNVSAVSNGFSEIGTNKWVSSSYLSTSKPGTTTSSSTSSVSYKTVVGSTYKLKARTALYSKSNLTGTRYDYLANTSVKVLSHSSSTVDYIYIAKTGRYCYCPVSAISGTLSNVSSSKVTVAHIYVPATGRYAYCPYSDIEKVNGVYRLKENTTLYSKSNLTGTRYNYLAKTKVIIKNTL